MVRGALIVCLALQLGACAAPTPQPFRVGAEQNAPHGWIDFCRRHSSDTSCLSWFAHRGGDRLSFPAVSGR